MYTDLKFKNSNVSDWIYVEGGGGKISSCIRGMLLEAHHILSADTYTADRQANDRSEASRPSTPPPSCLYDGGEGGLGMQRVACQ